MPRRNEHLTVCQLFKLSILKKARVVIVTGTPSTGKTRLAKQIAKKYSFHLLKLKQFAQKHHCIAGYDKKRKCTIINEHKLIPLLEKELKQRKQKNQKAVIDSHLAHLLSPKIVEVCIVTRCELKELYRRLKNKGYAKKKIEENMECEIMEVCLQEAREQGHKILIVDTTKKIKKKGK